MSKEMSVANRSSREFTGGHGSDPFSPRARRAIDRKNGIDRDEHLSDFGKLVFSAVEELNQRVRGLLNGKDQK